MCLGKAKVWYNNKERGVKPLIKKCLASITALIIYLSMSINVSANEKEEITKTQTYASKTEDKEAEFPKVITENGVSYELVNISYKSKEEKTESGGEKREKQMSQNNLSSSSYNWPDKINISDNGKTYTGTLNRSSIQYYDNGAESRTQEVTDEKTYEGYNGDPDVPSETTASVRNPFTNNMENVTLYLDHTEKYDSDKTEQQDYTYTFINYNARRYNIAGKIFYHDDNNCPLNTDKDFVYSLLDLDKSVFTITNIQWVEAADASTNTRKASISVERKIPVVKAYYFANHKFVGAHTYSSTAQYTYMVNADEKTTYKITATAEYKKKKEETSKSEKGEQSKQETLSSGTTTFSKSSDDTDIGNHERVTDITTIYKSKPLDNDNEQDTNESTKLPIVVGCLFAIITSGLAVLFHLRKRGIVYDSNFLKLGTCKISKAIDLSSYIDSTNKNLSVKCFSSSIAKNVKEISAMGENIEYSCDGKFIEVINPNNYKVKL